MSKYIDADKLDKKFNEILDNPEEYDKPIHDILREFYFAPSADVFEVVHCSDCKYAHRLPEALTCRRLTHWYQVKGDDYCSKGKKREENNDGE